MLTLSDTLRSTLSLYGPPNVSHVLASARSFLSRFAVAQPSIPAK